MLLKLPKLLPPRHRCTLLAGALWTCSLAGATLAQTAGPAPAPAPDAAPAPTPNAAPANPLALHGQALLYVTGLSVAGGNFNPENRLAQVPSQALDSELRLDISGKNRHCNASARLRAQYTRSRSKSLTNEADSSVQTRENRETFVNSGGLACRIGNNFELALGREVLQWGSSFYLSPSNPFFIQPGKTNPVQELYGKDMLQANWFLQDGMTLSLMRNFRQGRLEPSPTSFSPASALKFDWVGNQASGGAIVSQRGNGVKRLGLYGTWTYSKALLLYLDTASGRGNAGQFAQATAGSGNTGGLDWRFTQSKLHDGKLYHTSLLGAAWTFESGWSLTAELLHSNEGYGSAERAAWQTASAQAAPLFLANGPATAGAAQLLATALNPNLPAISNNTLFLQLLRNEWNDKGDVALRWVRPLGSGSGTALSASLTYYVGSNVQLFLLASHATGGANSDFGRLVNQSWQTGLRGYF